MKILFVCGAGIVSGKEIITLSLIEGLRARGHEVRCLASTWGCEEFGERLEALNTPYKRIALGFISRSVSWPTIRMNLHQLITLPGLWRDYKSYLREFQPDVVVQSNFHHAFLLWPLLDARNTFFHLHDPLLQTSFYRRLFKFLARRVRAFVGVSGYIRNMLIQLGVPEEKAFFVLNGISPSENVESPRDTTNAADAISIGIVGQIGDWKGHDDFVEALGQLKKSELPFTAAIYGNGDSRYIQTLKDRIAEHDLTSRVRWAGVVSRTKDIFGGLHVCVVPSRSQDPCPTVAMEAAHFGVPVIATRQGGLPELIRDGETGYLVDAKAPEQISGKLKLLIQDEELRGRMARAARRHGVEHLTRDRMVEQMEDIFARASNRNGDRK